MSSRSLLTAYSLLAFFGWAGAHRFYLRHYGWGFIYLITFGGFTLGILVDAFLLPGLVDEANRAELAPEGKIPRARALES